MGYMGLPELSYKKKFQLPTPVLPSPLTETGYQLPLLQNQCSPEPAQLHTQLHNWCFQLHNSASNQGRQLPTPSKISVKGQVNSRLRNRDGKCSW